MSYGTGFSSLLKALFIPAHCIAPYLTFSNGRWRQISSRLLLGWLVHSSLPFILVEWLFSESTNLHRTNQKILFFNFTHTKCAMNKISTLDHGAYGVAPVLGWYVGQTTVRYVNGNNLEIGPKLPEQTLGLLCYLIATMIAIATACSRCDPSLEVIPNISRTISKLTCNREVHTSVEIISSVVIGASRAQSSKEFR